MHNNSYWNIKSLLGVGAEDGRIQHPKSKVLKKNLLETARNKNGLLPCVKLSRIIFVPVPTSVLLATIPYK